MNPPYRPESGVSQNQEDRLTATVAPNAIAQIIVPHLLAVKLCLADPTAISPPVRNSCSITKGILMAALNGHPTIAPTAVHTVAFTARLLPVEVDVAGWNP